MLGFHLVVGQALFPWLCLVFLGGAFRPRVGTRRIQEGSVKTGRRDRHDTEIGRVARIAYTCSPYVDNPKPSTLWLFPSCLTSPVWLGIGNDAKSRSLAWQRMKLTGGS